MLVTQKAITGLESVEVDDLTPEFALIEFYHAFNTGDLNLMAENWEMNDEVSMSNPLGGVKRGWGTIKEVYERIFNGKTRVYVEFYDYSIHQSGDMFCAVGRERGFFQLDENKIELAIRTSRIYRKGSGRWLQIHHHGSIETPELLAEYQQAVHGR